MNFKYFLLFITTLFIISFGCVAQIQDGCTTVTVGRLASVDGSVMTSHTADSHKGHTWIRVVPHKKHKPGSKCAIYKNSDRECAYEDLDKQIAGYIPQVPETYGYVYAFYGVINEHQLAIGETTFTGLEKLQSKKGLFNCYELSRIVCERCKTARGAIKLIGELIKKYGYNDFGECLTIADTKEVWQLEMVGPGKGKFGGAWVALKIPDDHIGVCANASRIRQFDPKSSDCMTSGNVKQVAIDNGCWNPKSGKPFEFCYAFNPTGRTSFACTRREWRVFDLLAPSLKLDPRSNDYPFTVKPEIKVSPAKIMELFRDTFEGTEFDMTKFMVVEVKDEDSHHGHGDKKSKKKVRIMKKSDYANPFLYYDEMYLHKINGGWGELGERPLARAYCMYVHVTQSRSWLPDPIGGVVWMGLANPAMTTYVPMYCQITDLPKSYTEDGRNNYRRGNAWWGFVRVAKIASRIWGKMRKDVAKVRDKLQKDGFKAQKEIEKKAAELYKKNPAKAVKLLNKYTNDFCNKVVDAYWKLGDDLWVKYQDKM